MKSTIHPHNRYKVYWDIFVLFVTLIALFEIPFDLMVGWGAESIQSAFSRVFSLVFVMDIFFSCLTIRREERRIYGLWGTMPLLNPQRYQENIHLAQEARVLKGNREIVSDYISSRDFLIDLISTIPWEMLSSSSLGLSGLRLLRTLKLLRLFRLLRLTRLVYVFEKLRRVNPSMPSVERLIFILISIPWVAHILTCVYCYLSQPEIKSYGQSFERLSLLLLSQISFHEPTSILDRAIFFIAVVISVVFIASVTGNLAALYTTRELNKIDRYVEFAEHHSVIIGWNDSIFSIIRQLLSNPSSGKKTKIIVLTMIREEDAWRQLDDAGLSVDPRRFRVINGSTQSRHSIKRLGIVRASHLIILGEVSSMIQASMIDVTEREEELSRLVDIETFKTILACVSAIKADLWLQESSSSRRAKRKITIIASINNDEIAQIIRSGLPRGDIENYRVTIDYQVVSREEVISHCIAQMVSNVLLFKIYDELFTFTNQSLSHIGSEVYIYRAASILPASIFARDTLTYDDLFTVFDSAILIGYIIDLDSVEIPEQLLCEYELSSSGEVLILNPGGRSTIRDHVSCFVNVEYERAMRITPETKLVFIAKLSQDITGGHSISRFGDYQRSKRGFENRDLVYDCAPQRILLLGKAKESRRLGDVMSEYLNDGSEIYWEFDEDRDKPNVTYYKCSRQTIHHHLAGLDFDTTVISSNSDQRSRVMSSDSESLLELAWTNGVGAVGCGNVIIELREVQNTDLAKSFSSVAYILSNEVMSNYLVQLADNPLKSLVFRELLNKRGSEIYIVSPLRFLRRGERLEMYTFRDMERAIRDLDEVLIGYSYVFDGQELSDPISYQIELSPHHKDRKFGEIVHVNPESGAEVGVTVRGLIVIAPLHPVGEYETIES